MKGKHDLYPTDFAQWDKLLPQNLGRPRDAYQRYFLYSQGVNAASSKAKSIPIGKLYMGYDQTSRESQISSSQDDRTGK